MITSATLTRSDASTFEWFSVAGAIDVPQPLGAASATPVVVLAPAMGMPAGYYMRFLEALSQSGLHGVTYEQQGHEVGGQPTGWRRNFGYAALVGDMEAVIAQARLRFPDSPVIVLGHSLGGQVGVAALGQNPKLCDGLVLIASGTPHWRAYGAKILIVAALFPAIAHLLGHFPGTRMKFAGRESRSLITQWGRFAFTGKLPVGEDGLDRPVVPVKTIAMTNDWLAPPRAVRALGAKLSTSPATHLVIDEPGIDHYKWARRPETVLPQLIEWIAGQYRTR